MSPIYTRTSKRFIKHVHTCLYIFRRIMATALVVTFIPSAVLIYVTMETGVIDEIPKMASASGVSYTTDGLILQSSMLKPRQVNIHFYSFPRWFNITNAFRGCPSNCSLSTGTKHYHERDVVIFFGPGLRKNPVPKRRGQIWVLYGKEAPPNHKHIRKWKGLFNWTMTYRRDSDFQHLHGDFQKCPHPSARLPNITLKFTTAYQSINASNSVKTLPSTAWFVSHCKTQSKRREYVGILRNTQPVDIFGACGSKANKCTKGKDNECLMPYKFYLSFENSLCRDYITEKALSMYIKTQDTIPITRGNGGLNSLYLPPGSFIDTIDYLGPDKLGQFLNYLSKNETLFLRYFEWRRHYKASLDIFQSFCELCKRMHKPGVNTRYRRVYKDIHGWLFGSRDVKICTNPTDLLK
ncbi:alpha-(1,3)-fucosyltransferase C-like [Pecten maximus]|uniref:alpha-(1,3)-fucosyltransferase C-like n=1 Tax=Pecten maximus TaxID=6579 RepID=UPI0014590E26|nr:alpha-(1,3)-fucosyltransferase C-like [Pecten maximus]